MSVSVGYPGPAGSHSDAAAAVLVPDAARAVALPSFVAVVGAAVEADVELGVLPIESSLTGAIAETHDLLYDAPLSIVREASLHINHCLVALPDASRDELRTIRSHPQAFDQCRTLLGTWRVKCVAAATTADAAREVAELHDPTQGAIASRVAAETYGLAVLAEDVSDRSAYTRFVAVAPHTRIDHGQAWRTALWFVTDHRPGALFRALEPFARHGLNLVQLVSRPLPDSPWRYRFDAVLDGHVFDAEVSAALADLRQVTRRLRLFGSYPAEAPR
jgi:prephenate dehydratase